MYLSFSFPFSFILFNYIISLNFVQIYSSHLIFHSDYDII
nr:MAG TPA: hypothetical protein [Caudoviricetes sp.]